MGCHLGWSASYVAMMSDVRKVSMLRALILTAEAALSTLSKHLLRTRHFTPCGAASSLFLLRTSFRCFHQTCYPIFRTNPQSSQLRRLHVSIAPIRLAPSFWVHRLVASLRSLAHVGHECALHARIEPTRTKTVLRVFRHQRSNPLRLKWGGRPVQVAMLSWNFGRGVIT